MEWAIVGFGGLSAASWLAAAIVTPVVAASYWDGLPAPLIKRLRLGTVLNALGALCASIAIGCQAWLTYTNIG